MNYGSTYRKLKEVIYMPDFITEYWVEWIFGVIAAMLVAGYRSLKKRIDSEISERQAIKNGVRSFLRRQIIMDCEAAIQKGYASTEVKDMIDDMYHSYHALGGNGVVTNLKDQMMNLPTKPAHI